jgi:hypothetical protein
VYQLPKPENAMLTQALTHLLWELLYLLFLHRQIIKCIPKSLSIDEPARIQSVRCQLEQT